MKIHFYYISRHFLKLPKSLKKQEFKNLASLFLKSHLTDFSHSYESLPNPRNSVGDQNEILVSCLTTISSWTFLRNSARQTFRHLTRLFNRKTRSRSPIFGWIMRERYSYEKIISSPSKMSTSSHATFDHTINLK